MAIEIHLGAVAAGNVWCRGKRVGVRSQPVGHGNEARREQEKRGRRVPWQIGRRSEVERKLVKQCGDDRRQRGRRQQVVVEAELVRIQCAVVPGTDVEQAAQREPSRVDAVWKLVEIVMDFGKCGEDAAGARPVIKAFPDWSHSVPV